jgi:beta-lactamase class A
MSRAVHLNALQVDLAGFPGTASVWCGPIDGPAAYAHAAEVTHYAASTMKVSVLAALYRAAEDGSVDLDSAVPVHNDFSSAAPGAPRFRCSREDDNDSAVWDRLGAAAPLRWLADRMIVRSSNLATNIVLSQVGLDAVARVWQLAGARDSRTGRGIEDGAAREAGIRNLVTAADLAALLGSIAAGAAGDRAGASPPLAGRRACRAMLDVLSRQEYGEELAAGLPAGTRVAHKDGWVSGIRHAAGVVFPPDAAPYAVVACTSAARTDTPDGEAARLITRVAAASWADRHQLGTAPVGPAGDR